ncbi:hypothetical protein AVEN_143975-1 [Araneus ventricosus]|uniref:Uncharacterized protein n=1 Tax=Araneus ventricosus TaxID=182803 RepID=A0A4Y2WA66_ARAVE|nr:hypothetical protein AVEN_143975-1 [Araneus ventricosus]
MLIVGLLAGGWASVVLLKLYPIPQGSDRPCAWCRRGVGGSFAAMFVLSAVARVVCRSIGHSVSPYAMAGQGVFLCILFGAFDVNTLSVLDLSLLKCVRGTPGQNSFPSLVR